MTQLALVLIQRESRVLGLLGQVSVPHSLCQVEMEHVELEIPVVLQGLSADLAPRDGVAAGGRDVSANKE